MPDIVLKQGSSLPMDMETRYRDMGDGTHALAVAVGSGGAHPNAFSTNDSFLVAQANEEIVAAPASGRIHITDITMGTDVAGQIRLTSGGVDVYGPWPFAANGGLAKPQTTPIIVAGNLAVTSNIAGLHGVSVQGYVE